MPGSVEQLVDIFVLSPVTSLIPWYSFKCTNSEKHKILIPLDEQVQQLLKKSNKIKDLIKVVQDFYWNPWLSSKALESEESKNLLVLCTKDFCKKIEEEKEIQNALSIDSSHRNLRKIYLDINKQNCFC